ncbi:hypothetical protein J6590_089577 [Homalodisca vitripennis]|nr:hypothetical protein J6590_089577 [Homalodisca vitripennis]
MGSSCYPYHHTQVTGYSRSIHLLNESYPKSAVVAKAINGIRASGIWPINNDLFEDLDCAVHTNMSVVIRNDAVTRDKPNDDVRPSTSQFIKNGSDRPFMPEIPSSTASVGTSRVKKTTSIKDISHLPDTSVLHFMKK